jgi:hypothetical protein
MTIHLEEVVIDMHRAADSWWQLNHSSLARSSLHIVAMRFDFTLDPMVGLFRVRRQSRYLPSMSHMNTW